MSRLASKEHRKNIRKIFLLGLATFVSFVVFIFFGIPVLGKLTVFVTGFGNKENTTKFLDETAPATPLLNTLPESTNQPNIEINGSTESGGNVVLLLNNAKKEVLANNSGKFSFKYELKKGENSVSAYVIDSAGNESEKTDELVVVFDSTSPELVINEPDNGKEFFGSKQRQVSIKGITESEVDLAVNTRPLSVDQDGEFVFVTTLSEGENNFEFNATDPAGNSTEKSIQLKFSP